MLKCPACEAREVEQYAVDSNEGKALLDQLKTNQKITIPDYYFTPSYKEELKNLVILHCQKCQLIEVVNLQRKESVLRTKLRTKQAKGKSVLAGLLLAGAILTISVAGLFAIDLIFFPSVNIHLLRFASAVPFPLLAEVMAVLAAIGFVFFLLVSLGLSKLMRSYPGLLESTLKMHRAMEKDDKLYFFEYSTEREGVDFKSTVSRAFYGSVLVLGICIMIIENFLVIPSLEPYFFAASTVVIVAIVVAIPFILIFLFISPLITKEINLYYHDKKHRVVKNVGEWLDNALQLFAGIDILLTAIIIVDSNLGGWILVILCLVGVVFSWFLIFMVIFNNYYHAEMKNAFKEHLKTKYLLPIRQSRLAPQFYYCQNCGELLDFIHDDKCSKCGEEINKCVICGDVMTNPTAKSRRTAGNEENRLLELAKKMERRLDHEEDSGRTNELMCPKCGAAGHVDEMYSWVKIRHTCPACHEKISFGDDRTTNASTRLASAMGVGEGGENAPVEGEYQE
jgi:hypothetical protein